MVDPELGEARTGFKGSSWTDGGRGPFPRGTNKPSVENLKKKKKKGWNGIVAKRHLASYAHALHSLLG